MTQTNFLKFFVLTFVLIAVACGSDSDSSDDNNNNSNTSITLTANATNVEEGETITFTVTNNSNENVTSQSTIKINGNEISGNTWTPSAFGVYSASAVHDNVNSNVVTIQVKEPLTSIILSTDSDPVFEGDQIIFAVTGNNGDNLTSAATITYNGNDIGGNGYTATASGLYEFVATYDTFTSNTLQVDVLPPPTKFNQRVLIEDYTGTWCGYCPRVSFAIEQVHNTTSDASVVAIHNGDAMATSLSGMLENAFSINGWPTAYLNRDNIWSYPEPNNVSQVTNLANGEADLGLAMDFSLNGNTINLDVNAKFGGLYNENNSKLIVYIVEDGLIFNQENYTSYYGGTAVIANFEHNDVLRASLTDVMGDAIPNSELTPDNVYTRSFTVNVPSNVSNSANISIVAFVVKSTDEVMNVRTAHIGDSQSFEEL